MEDCLGENVISQFGFVWFWVPTTNVTVRNRVVKVHWDYHGLEPVAIYGSAGKRQKAWSQFGFEPYLRGMCFNQAPWLLAFAALASTASSRHTHSLGFEPRAAMAPAPNTKRMFTVRLGIVTAWLGWKRLFHNSVLNCDNVFFGESVCCTIWF